MPKNEKKDNLNGNVFYRWVVSFLFGVEIVAGVYCTSLRLKALAMHLGKFVDNGPLVGVEGAVAGAAVGNGAGGGSYFDGELKGNRMRRNNISKSGFVRRFCEDWEFVGGRWDVKRTVWQVFLLTDDGRTPLYRPSAGGLFKFLS